MHKFFRLCFATLLVFALSALAFSQSTTTGAIEIKVQDPNGAVVPGAAVTARNVETNQESSATTDDEGRVRVVNLQPGNYTVTTDASGFGQDRKSTRLNSSHANISYAVFCLK